MTNDSLRPDRTPHPPGTSAQTEPATAKAFLPRRQSHQNVGNNTPSLNLSASQSGHPATNAAVKTGQNRLAVNPNSSLPTTILPGQMTSGSTAKPTCVQPNRPTPGATSAPRGVQQLPGGAPNTVHASVKMAPNQQTAGQPRPGTATNRMPQPPVSPIGSAPTATVINGASSGVKTGAATGGASATANPPSGTNPAAATVRTSILAGKPGTPAGATRVMPAATPHISPAQSTLPGKSAPSQSVLSGQSTIPGQQARPGVSSHPIPVALPNGSSGGTDVKGSKQVRWADVSAAEAASSTDGAGDSEEKEVWAGRAPRKKIASYRRPYRFDILTWIGEILITLGVLGGLLAFWDVYVTDWQVKDFNNAAIKQFKQGTKCKATVSKDIRRDPPPAVKRVGVGEPLAILHYPSWNFMTVPVREGADQYIIDTGAAGHYAETAMPGEIGNFSVAAHRRSYGSNFRRVDTLKEGDPVVVETPDTWIIFKVYNKEIVDPSAGEVIAPVPNHPEQQPTERLMTMTTCHPEYGNWQRFIVHLKYDHWVPKSSGVPEELASGGNACTN